MCTWLRWLDESSPRSAMKRQPSLSRCVFQMCCRQTTYKTFSDFAFFLDQLAIS